MEANGLILKEIGSNTKPFENIKSQMLESDIFRDFNEKGFVVAWLDYKVLIGTWGNEHFYFPNDETFENKYIQRLRIFNIDKELLVWRTGSGFHARLREDNMKGLGTHVVVAEQVLFGTKKGDDRKGNFTQITEDRGTTITLPFKDLQVDNKNRRVFIKTHNYVDYNAVYQATYVDCRFVGFSPDKGNLL